MTQTQRLFGMLTALAMMVSGVIVLALSIGLIVQALSSDPESEGVAVAPTATLVPLVSSTVAVENTAVLPSATTAPQVTATFTDLTINPTVTTAPPSETALPASPTTAPSATLLAPTQTFTPTLTATTAAAITPTSTALVPSAIPSVTLTATMAAPSQLTLITAPIPTPAALVESACASLDGQTTAGLYQVETPAQIGVEQRLCLGGYPMTESVTVYLTGRSAMAITLRDEDGNGFGYAEVRYVPTRNDRNRPLNMTAAAESVSSSGQITIERTIPGNALSPQVGTPFTTFYTVLTFPDNTQRDLYLYRRAEGDTFTYIRRIFLLPETDDCVPFNPCFASDFSLSREGAGEYRLVEYSPTAGFRLFPSEIAPLGFVISNPQASPTPTSTAEVTPTLPLPTVEASATTDPNATVPVPVPSETPSVVPTATVEPSTTPESSPTPEATPTLAATPTAIVTAQDEG